MESTEGGILDISGSDTHRTYSESSYQDSKSRVTFVKIHPVLWMYMYVHVYTCANHAFEKSIPTRPKVDFHKSDP